MSTGLNVATMQTTIGGMQRVYLYKFVFEDVPEALPSEYKEFAKTVDFFNLTTKWPSVSTSFDRQAWAGEFFWVRTTDRTSGEGTAEWILDSTYKTYDFFMALKQLNGTLLNHSMSPAMSSVCNVILMMYDVDKETILKKVKLKNFLVSSVSVSDLDKAGKSFSKLTVGFNYNKVETMED